MSVEEKKRGASDREPRQQGSFVIFHSFSAERNPESTATVLKNILFRLQRFNFLLFNFSNIFLCCFFYYFFFPPFWFLKIEIRRGVPCLAYTALWFVDFYYVIYNTKARETCLTSFWECSLVVSSNTLFCFSLAA